MISTDGEPNRGQTMAHGMKNPPSWAIVSFFSGDSDMKNDILIAM